MRKNVSSFGFTIVELLIVIVVIAILAAITIVSFNGIQSRAYDTSVKSDLTALTKKMELYSAENGRYPDPTFATLETFGFKANGNAYLTNPGSDRNLIYCTNSARSTYALLAKSKSGSAFWHGAVSGGLQSFTATWNATTTSGSLCAGAPVNLSSLSADQTAGYAYGLYGWAAWTGVSN